MRFHRLIARLAQQFLAKSVEYLRPYRTAMIKLVGQKLGLPHRFRLGTIDVMENREQPGSMLNLGEIAPFDSSRVPGVGAFANLSPGLPIPNGLNQLPTPPVPTPPADVALAQHQPQSASSSESEESASAGRNSTKSLLEELGASNPIISIHTINFSSSAPEGIAASHGAAADLVAHRIRVPQNPDLSDRLHLSARLRWIPISLHPRMVPQLRPHRVWRRRRVWRHPLLPRHHRRIRLPR